MANEEKNEIYNKRAKFIQCLILVRQKKSFKIKQLLIFFVGFQVTFLLIKQVATSPRNALPQGLTKSRKHQGILSKFLVAS